MRIPILFALTVLILTLSVDSYIYIAALRRVRSRIPAKIQLISAILLYAFLAVGLLLPTRSGESAIFLDKMWILFSYITVFTSKLVFVFIDLLGHIPCLFRKKAIPYCGLAGGLAGLAVFIAMWWGALINRFNVNTVEIDIPIENLPAAFDDYRIVQISDLHVGTYGNDTVFIDRLVKHINALNPDIILFTGDIVNQKSSELTPFVASLSNLSAPDGVMSILGNHDYGDYYDWKTPEDKSRSFNKLVSDQEQMGWTLLRNEHRIIKHAGDSIAIIGVENVGDPPFAVYGDLSISYPDLSDGVTKILMSHNPVHWDMEIADRDNVNVALTLSGHTHAMQIELFGWSPASWRYKNWGGLYNDNDGSRRLYVNIGAGTVGMPMRLGATPEVTVITLKRKEADAD